MGKLKCLFFFALILLVVVQVFSQGPTDRFTVGQYGFEIALPAEPTGAEEKNFTLLEYQVDGEYVVWDEGTKQYAALGMYRPFGTKLTLTEAEKTNIIAAYKKVFLADLKAHNIMTSETPYSFGESKGVEIRGVSSSRIVARLFFVRNRLIELTVSSAESSGFEQQTKVLDSFRLLTKEETIKALKRENMPEELSQGSASARPINDLQSAVLKGNVRNIVEESQETPAAPREIAYEAYYNSSGNLTREYSYNLGYPQEITRWGWVAGKRVSSTNTILFESGELPIQGELATTGMMGQQKEGKLYGSRHEFTYDDKNRVVEEKVFGADESPRFTVKFIYSPTGREKHILDNTGQFLKRTFEVMDQKGNVTELRVLDLSGRPYSKTSFTYEFDAAGNWIVRRVQGGTARKPWPTHFRKITYYEDIKKP